MWNKNFNRNLIGGKRCNRGYKRLFGLSLKDRLIVECKRLANYHKRIAN